MAQNNVQKPSKSVTISGSSESLSVLTSEQRLELEKYLNQIRNSFDKYSFDGDLCDVVKEIFKDDPVVLKALDDSIHDSNCTKQFMDVSKTYSQMEGFYEPEPKNGLWLKSVRVACALVKESMKPRLLTPLRLKVVSDLDDIWTNPKASAGAISIGSSKREAKQSCFEAARRIKRLLADGSSFDQLLIPALPFHRSQISKFLTEDNVYDPKSLEKKDRLVWGLDGATVSVEGQYAQPLIEHLSHNWFNYAGGKTPRDLRDNIRLCANRKNFWASVDFSKFDQTVPSWLIRWAFSVVKDFYDPKYHRELDFICYNFINTLIAIPGEGITQKHKGIPSGSNFTQIIGSMCNAVMVLSFIASQSPNQEFQACMDYVRSVVKIPGFPELAIFAMGDDDLVFASDEVNLSMLSEYVHAVFGVKIKAEKCDFGDQLSKPVFLKRTWRGSSEYQNPCYMVVNICHPERRRTYEGYSPWHIMYGIYLTYSGSFPRWMTERFLVEKMNKSGGVKALERIPRSDLPGVFRAFGDDALKMMVFRAESLYPMTKVG